MTRPLRGGLLAGGAGALLWTLGALVEPRQAMFSYLAAFAWGLSTAVAALILVMIGHLTDARWFVVLRRLAENVAATIPLFAVLWIPLLLGADALYPWMHPAALEPHTRRTLGHEAVYLNLPFWTARAALYFALWSGVALLLRRWSVRQDSDPDPELTRKQRRLSAGAVFPAGLALTFAAWDWLMALAPGWYSTAFGVYVFAGGMLGALGALAVVLWTTQRGGRMGVEVAEGNVHALGKMMLVFVIFWAYIAYAQGFLIWIADLPEEVTWYVSRGHGSWAGLGWVLILGHFVIPFLLLLSWRWKHRLGFVAGVGAWLLAMHYLDVYWMVLPSLYPAGIRPSWLDAAALLAVGGFGVAFGAFRERGAARVPIGDPYLPQSLRYTST